MEAHDAVKPWSRLALGDAHATCTPGCHYQHLFDVGGDCLVAFLSRCEQQADSILASVEHEHQGPAGLVYTWLRELVPKATAERTALLVGVAPVIVTTHFM